MRVTINYSTELEEVPQECYALMERLGKELSRINEAIAQGAGAYDRLATDPSAELLEEILRPMASMYNRLTNSATRIKECMLLLDGFVTTSLNPPPVDPQEIEQMQTASNEIDQLQQELNNLAAAVEVTDGE